MEVSFFFATPCHSSVTPEFCHSALNATKELSQAGIDHEWAIHPGCSIVSIARNLLAKRFLESNHTHLFWIDADISFSPDDIAKVWRLDADIAVAACSTRSMKKLVNMWKGGKRIDNIDQFSDPVEVDRAGTGFMCIKRSVIEAMEKSRGSFIINEKIAPALYMTPTHDGEFEGEDHFFCRIAREDGFTIVLDPSVRPGHVGQYEYKL